MNFFSDFSWHSVEEPGSGLRNKRTVKRLKANASTIGRFMKISKDGSFLIHKSTKQLWKFSKDKKSIEPVFEDDVLTMEQL